MIGNILAVVDPVVAGTAILLLTGAALMIKKITDNGQEEKLVMVKGPDGKLINIEELVYQKKYIDFRRHSWDSINVVEFPGI